MSIHQEPWMVAILLPSAMSPADIESCLGTNVARREGRHDLPLKADHSYLSRQGDLAISVDLFAHTWHDTSGNDEGPESPMYMHDEDQDRLLSAPWSLKRAVQQYRGTDDAAIAAANHSAFVLLRVPLQPGGNAISSYEKLLNLSLRLLERSPGSCFFNPRGEVLSGKDRLATALSRYRAGELPPLDMLINSRSFDVGAGWSLVDSVGMQQVSLPDQEVVYNWQSLPLADAIHFVRNLAMHLIQHQTPVDVGDTASGPGESLWEALLLGRGSVSPSRPVIRWLPESREGMPLGMDVP